MLPIGNSHSQSSANSRSVNNVGLSNQEPELQNPQSKGLNEVPAHLQNFPQQNANLPKREMPSLADLCASAVLKNYSFDRNRIEKNTYLPVGVSEYLSDWLPELGRSDAGLPILSFSKQLQDALNSSNIQLKKTGLLSIREFMKKTLTFYTKSTESQQFIDTKKKNWLNRCKGKIFSKNKKAKDDMSKKDFDFEGYKKSFIEYLLKITDRFISDVEIKNIKDNDVSKEVIQKSERLRETDIYFMSLFMDEICNSEKDKCLSSTSVKIYKKRLDFIDELRRGAQSKIQELNTIKKLSNATLSPTDISKYSEESMVKILETFFYLNRFFMAIENPSNFNF